LEVVFYSLHIDGHVDLSFWC